MKNDTGIIPAKNHLIVKKNKASCYVESDDGTSEFVLPKDYHQLPMSCTVVDVGEFAGFDIKPSVGDEVIISKYGSTKVMVGNEEFHLCNIKDIIGII